MRGAPGIAKSPLAIALVLAVVVFVWLEKTIPPGLELFVVPDTYHYAEMGRQIARGEGFTSLQAYPYLLAWFRAHGVSTDPPWPNIARFPLIPFVYGAVFPVLGASKVAIDVVHGFFFVATAVTTLLLGARLFGMAPALAASIAFATNSAQMVMARLGLLETGAAFFLVASMLALVATLDEGARPTGKHAIGRPIWLGLVSGLGVLQRYDLLSFAITAGLVVLVGRGRVGRRQLLWMLLGFSVPIVFWVGRNSISFGDPIAFVGIDRNLFGKVGTADPYRSHEYVGFWPALREKSDLILAKLPDFVWPFARWDTVFGEWTAWLVPAFVVGSAYLLAVRHPAVRPWVALVLAFLIRTAIFTVTHHERRFYLSFAPLLYVFSLGALWTLFVSVARPARVLRGAVATAVVVGLLFPVRWALPRVFLPLVGIPVSPFLGLPPIALPAPGNDARAAEQATGGAASDESSHYGRGPAGDASPQPAEPIAAIGAKPATPLAKLRNDTFLFRAIRERLPANGVIATSWTEEVSWYGERPALYIGPDKLRVAERLGVRPIALLYRTNSETSVVNSLRRQGLLDDFVVVYRGHLATLWVHRKLARAWPRMEGTSASQVAFPVASRLAAVTHDAAPPRPRAPRLVVLYAPCTVNADHLAPYRAGVFYTPHLARFAEQATVFLRNQSEADQSGTAYAALLTGREADGHRVFAHPLRLPDDVTTITEAFAEAGWDVHFWADHGMASPRLSYAQGVPRQNLSRKPLSGDDPRLLEILDRVARDPSYRALVVTNFTVTHYPYKDRIAELRARFPEQTAALTAGLTDERIKHLALTYQATLALQKDFPGTRRRLGLTDDDVRDLVRVVELLYVSNVAYLDELFGSVVHAIDARGLDDESLIVFTADHGEVLYRDNALFPWSHDFQLAPEVLRTPLLIRGGGARPGAFPAVTRAIDVLPTIAALAGVPVRDPGVTGVDLSRAVRGEAEAPRLLAFGHTPKVRSDVVKRGQESWLLFGSYFPTTSIEEIWVSVRDGDVVAKYRRREDGGFGFEVFDLASDPEERRNLYRPGDARHAALAEKLVEYKRRLVEAHDQAAGVSKPREVDADELEKLRQLGYVQ